MADREWYGRKESRSADLFSGERACFQMTKEDMPKAGEAIEKKQETMHTNTGVKNMDDSDFK